MPEIYTYMTKFTEGWLKYQNSYVDLTKADFYMNFRFYRGSWLPSHGLWYVPWHVQEVAIPFHNQEMLLTFPHWSRSKVSPDSHYNQNEVRLKTQKTWQMPKYTI